MSDKLSFDEKVKLVEHGKIDKKTGKAIPFFLSWRPKKV